MGSERQGRSARRRGAGLLLGPLEPVVSTEPEPEPLEQREAEAEEPLELLDRLYAQPREVQEDAREDVRLGAAVRPARLGVAADLGDLCVLVIGLVASAREAALTLRLARREGVPVARLQRTVRIRVDPVGDE